MSIVQIIKKTVMTLAFGVLVAAPIVTIAAPQYTFAAPAPNCERGLLGMPNWYRGLTDGECNIISPNETLAGASEPMGIAGFIWHVALNVIEIGLFIAGYVALFFILYGGFLFMTGGGNSTQTENARKTIINAAVGFAISTAAIGATNLIFRLING